MQQYILHNDEFILADQPALAVSNRGFKFGDGLFESMRMAGGKLKYAEQHATRLKEGMQALKMDGSTLMAMHVSDCRFTARVRDCIRRKTINLDTYLNLRS
jgi:branched-subunit amino acid aminotransferase/4-amino-4-deoxychorismate lyase